MPVPIRYQDGEIPLYPTLSREDIDAARLSSWYSQFKRSTVPSTVIDLDVLGEKEAFLDWLDSDSIFLPIECNPPAHPEESDGSEEEVPSSPITLTSAFGARRRSDSQSSSSSSSSSEPPVFSLPKLTSAIQKAIVAHGGTVFPKLNWTSPRDAAFIIPQTRGPLCCSSPADIYLLLKSSDLVQHDLDPKRAYASNEDMDVEGPSTTAHGIKVELILRSFMEMNPSREVRCFVRNDILLGISQRDTNYYDHLQSPETRQTMCETIRAFWEDEIWGQYQGGKDYVFDMYLSSDLSSAFLIDFNPFRPSTDPLLFTYEELLDILNKAIGKPSAIPTPSQSDSESSPERLPILRIIDSQSNPLSNSIAPAFGSNMMPMEVVEMSQGRSIPEFREAWEDAVARGLQE